VIGVAISEKFGGPLCINIEALGLKIRPVRTANLWTLIPSQAKPFESVDCSLDIFRGNTIGIGILDAKDELAAGVTRVRPIKERGTNIADVQISGGRWREANAYGAGSISGHEAISY
jgi:hypothetical protein